MDNRPMWRNILSILFALFVIIRIAMTCSKANSGNSYSDTSYNDATSRLLQQSQEFAKVAAQNSDNDLFDKNYEYIGQMTESEKAVNNVFKIEKDTLYPLDLASKIELKKGSYIQKSYDDTLKTAIKLPDNTSIFIHSYSGTGDLLDNFKIVKKKKDIKNISLRVDKEDTKYLSYKYTNDGEKYNGFAMLTKESEYFSFIEFENNKISKDELEGVTLAFIAQIAKNN